MAPVGNAQRRANVMQLTLNCSAVPSRVILLSSAHMRLSVQGSPQVTTAPLTFKAAKAKPVAKISSLHTPSSLFNGASDLAPLLTVVPPTD